MLSNVLYMTLLCRLTIRMLLYNIIKHSNRSSFCHCDFTFRIVKLSLTHMTLMVHSKSTKTNTTTKKYCGKTARSSTYLAHSNFLRPWTNSKKTISTKNITLSSQDPDSVFAMLCGVLFIICPGPRVKISSITKN